MFFVKVLGKYKKHLMTHCKDKFCVKQSLIIFDNEANEIEDFSIGDKVSIP